MSNDIHAIVIGANGLIGAELTKQLLEDETYTKVTLVVRRFLDLEHDKLETKIVDFRDIHKDWKDLLLLFILLPRYY